MNGGFMSRILGIIAEYNPFHNGHAYHIQESKKRTGATAVVCVISGNFVQRGTPSLVNKWTKAEMALRNGADLVLELPVVYATASAERFAYGAMRLLNQLQIVDTVSFGIETEDISTLNNIANVLYREPKEFTTLLNHELSKGISFPKARENALMMYLNDIKRYANVLSGSNNILAIEYLKALKSLKSTMNVMGIKRQKVFYNQEQVVDEFASATAIRKLLVRGQTDEIRKVMPKDCYYALMEEVKKGKIVPDIRTFDKVILYTLRKMDIKEIAELPDVTEGLEYAIKEGANASNTVQDCINIVKSKRYTQTRLQRIFLYALLDLTKKKVQTLTKVEPYARVLGFNSVGRQMISDIYNANAKLNIVTSVKRFEEENRSKPLQELLNLDKLATDIYTLGYDNDSWAHLDYTNKMVILK